MKNIDFGNYLYNLRKQNKLTQRYVAYKLDVSDKAVSKWENGINLPDVTLIRQMSKDFNISVEDILDGKINSNKKKKNVLMFICFDIPHHNHY